MNLVKFSKILFVVLAILSGIFWIGLLMAGEATIENNEIVNQPWSLSPFIYLSLVVLLIAVVLTLMFSFKSLSANKEQMKSSLKGIGVLIGIFVVSYIIGDKKPAKIGDIEVSSFESGMISASLITFYILAVIAVGLMVYFNVVKSKK